MLAIVSMPRNPARGFARTVSRDQVRPESDVGAGVAPTVSVWVRGCPDRPQAEATIKQMTTASALR